MNRTTAHRRGMMLFELLIVIMLLGVFGLVASRAFVATMTLNHQVGVVHTQTMRFDAAMRAMRADVWGAPEMHARDGRIAMRSSDGQAIEWSVERDGTIVRTGKDTERWPVGVSGIAMRVEGVEAIVTVPDTRQGRGSELRLASQRQIAERMGL